jgi:hypothetical protein
MDHMAAQNPEFDPLRKWIHELNNRIAVILGMSELLAIEQLPQRAEERRKTIEQHALEVRQLLQSISTHYF